MGKLGDIAFEVSDRIDNPSKSGLERFVGLEHLDNESLTVKRWGSTDDVTSAMKLFKKGDMLFARRNAYLKRASMATFDGVCSGDAIVLRKKNEEYVNGLLPLILNMEKLWEFAIANASGSMSKRVKWRDLATFEIPLPPKEEQRHVVDMLWAAEDYIVKNEKLIGETELYKRVLMKEILSKGIGHSKFKMTKIGAIPEEWEVSSLKNHIFIKHGYAFKGEYFSDEGPILLTPGNFTEYGGLYFNEKNVKRYSGEYPEEFIFSPNDLVVVMTDLSHLCKILGNPAIIPSNEPILHNQRIGKIIFKSSNLDKKFLYHCLLSARFKESIRITATGSTVRHTSPTRIINIEFPLPPLPEQRHIADILSKLDYTIQKAHESINKTKELKKMLINQFLDNGLVPAFHINRQAKQLYETQVSE